MSEQSFEGKTLDDLDDVATGLANENRVEDAAFLRGVTDAILEQGKDIAQWECPDYGVHYRAGYKATQRWQNEVL
ncbi:MAG TPA: hypothetical protein VMW88_04170 [Thermoplasmata archaeon]|nr:hypothetical protein [Thermoplasmata archaeon]